ncbi:MAG: branched-chain amino acid ABC transporter permease, partial [Spirochaetota bacterium]
MLLLKRLDREIKLFSIVFILILIVPAFAGDYQIKVLSKFILFGIFAISLDLIWGYAGILSFGHAAYFGLGAYVTTLVLSHFQIAQSILAVVSSTVVPAILALILSLFLMYGKVSGVYFAIITLVVSLILEQVTIVWYSLTRGLTGFTPIPSLNLFGALLNADTHGGLLKYYYLISIIAAVVFFLLYLLSRSKFGLLLQAVKNDPRRAQ